MFKLFKSSALLLACLVLGAIAMPKLQAADSAAGKGSIKGVVYDADHKAVVGASVNLFNAADIPAHKPQANAPATQPGDNAGKPRPTPVATTTTDAQGAFTFADVAAGDYSVGAGLKGSGRGMAKVTVSSGNAASVEITLKPHARKPV